MTILHVNGVHRVRVKFCGCSTVVQDRLEYNQLLDAHLFPSSFKNPRTAFTFATLDCLSILSTRGNVSAYDYYHSLRCLTDICELQGFPTRYDELTFTIRRYRDLLTLKRAGVAHNDLGIDGLKKGDLAIECPASPLPGKNLPRDWKTLYADKPHLRAQFLALDANFRLKLKDRKLTQRNQPNRL